MVPVPAQWPPNRSNGDAAWAYPQVIDAKTVINVNIIARMGLTSGLGWIIVTPNSLSVGLTPRH